MPQRRVEERLEFVDLVVDDIVDLGVEAGRDALLACELVNCYERHGQRRSR
jgi:hypothetical protein